MRSRSRSIEGRLAARSTQAPGSASLGLQPLELDGKQNSWLYVPKQYRQDVPAAFVLLLHGAGSDATGGLELLQPLADSYNTLLLAVDSSSYTWDVIINSYGDDILSIDQALTQTFNRCAIDPTRLAIAGFSDGASYALSVGITNGDLFTHVIAFSPGFMAPAAQVGKPRVFISHGTEDRVLPIDRCSRRIVPQLKRANYDVLYQEFHGAHTVPKAIAEAALTWFTAD